MEYISKLEKTILGWLKNVPHLPSVARKWLGENVWWIAVIGLVGSCLAAVIGLIGVLGTASLVGTVAVSYYAVSTFTAWALVTSIVGLVFLAIDIILLAMAIKPLRRVRRRDGYCSSLFGLWVPYRWL